MSRIILWTLIVLAVVAGILLLPFLTPLATWAVIVGVAVASTKLYQRWSGAPATPGTSALSFGLGANGTAVALTMLSFLPARAGSSGRPMALVAFYFLFGLAMTVVGVAKAVQAWSHEKPLALSALALSLGLLPLEFLTFFALAAAKAFELEP